MILVSNRNEVDIKIIRENVKIYFEALYKENGIV